MSPPRAIEPRRRADFHRATGVLLVWRHAPPAPPHAAGQPPLVVAHPDDGPEVLLAVWDDGSVTALNGHVDLGTGIRTALAQLVADELDVPMDAVHMVLGSTPCAPNQGATIASASLQIHAQPLRQAAAQARAWLLARAAERLQHPTARLVVRDGVVGVCDDRAAVETWLDEAHSAADASPPTARSVPDPATSDPQAQPVSHRGTTVRYAELLQGAHIALELQPAVPLKPQAEHRVIGRSMPRVDIPAKATGAVTYVHDQRVPGMLHGRVVRPPYAGIDAGDFVGNTLEAVDESSIAHLPGIVAVVVIRDFVGVVAEREEQAEAAMRALRVTWKSWPGLPPLHDLATALRNNPATRRVLVDTGGVDAAVAGAAQRLQRDYVWPYQLHASIGPSCAVAHWHGIGSDVRHGAHDAAAQPGPTLTVWAGTQNPHVLRADLARLVGVAEPAVDVVRMEAAGCYGRNAADDVAADAALLSRAVGAPVRVQLTREQEHAWEPKGAAQLMQVDGGLDADGRVAAYDFQTSYPSNAAPTLALLLTRTIEPTAQAFEMGDRTAVPPYDWPQLRVAANDMAPILRASWLRGVSALPNSFAHESYVDELATAAGVDPVAFRLRNLKDTRAIELVQATAAKAGWLPHTAPQQQGAEGDLLQGQGFAYARYVHSKFPGYGAAWAAWVADVAVDRRTGEVHVRRVVVGHDAGLMVNPAGVQHQVHGNVLQTTSRALKERVDIEPSGAVASREWGSYPILNFREVPVVDVLLMPRPGEPPLGAGESSSVPGTAAIANAIYDATGVRLRAPPFTPEVVRAALDAAGVPGAADGRREPGAGPHAAPRRGADARRPTRGWLARLSTRRSAWAAGLAGLGSIAGFSLAALAPRAAIAPLAAPVAGVYTAQTIERGGQLAALGNCVVCHTAPGGAPNAGGRAMPTPFGRIVTTNLTPDAETGIGLWSYAAFERAMRHGVSRDGHRLYPAFPYTAFTRTTDADLTALYAWLMAQPPVRHPVSETRLAFPWSARRLMAAWNALWLQPGPQPAEPRRSAEWNRGAYLINGLGHCGACHTPRNAAGAELASTAYLAGARVDGWEAPALTALSLAPVPWSVEALTRYLRTGHSAEHGSASGPMQPVVRQLAQLPEADIRAMAEYLASQGPASTEAARVQAATDAVAQSRVQGARLQGPGARLWASACGACHHDGDGPATLGRNVPLALSTKLHSDRPDNLIRLILDGVRDPVGSDLGYMPAYRDSLNDHQIAMLAGYMRERFAPLKAAWPGLEDAVTALRDVAAH